MNTIIKKYSLLLLGMFCLLSCKKYLDAKSDSKLVIPSTLQDLQALLDNYPRVNGTDNSSSEVSSDNFYVSNTDYSSLIQPSQRMYIWANDHLFSSGSNDWSTAYDNVYRANTVLESIDNIERNPVNQTDWDNIKGQALFLRAKSFLQVAYVWSLAYDKPTATNDLGIPLRLTSDFNVQSVRSNVQETYDQIISDLKESIPLLFVTQLHVMRSSKPAAYALLARSYLSMRQYDSCYKYAALCLNLSNTLLDFNNLTASSTFPVPRFASGEVIYEGYVGVPTILNNSKAKIDSSLYQSYELNDLRKTVFFKNNNNGTYGFKGSYESGLNLFDGIATDEVYLMRAECLARLGNKDDAMTDLNTLLNKRWRKNTFVPFVATNASDALTIILAERRKELLMRGLRWMDLKRLNKEGANIILTRSVNGSTYILQPNDLKYALPIPEDVINISNMPQNPR
jgi:tetratricopeptide (TPR) repeat protein